LLQPDIFADGDIEAHPRAAFEMGAEHGPRRQHDAVALRRLRQFQRVFDVRKTRPVTSSDGEIVHHRADKCSAPWRACQAETETPLMSQRLGTLLTKIQRRTHNAAHSGSRHQGRVHQGTEAPDLGKLTDAMVSIEGGRPVAQPST
jgi:hypothetical protein